MFYFGLLLAICFVPGYLGASIPVQWAFLSMTLPWTLWRAVNLTAFHLLFFAFVLWAGLTTLWATNVGTSVMGMWTVLLWALSFWFGSSVDSLREVWRGLAAGLTISTAFAVLQVFGINLIEAPTLPPGTSQFHHAGLLYSHVIAGAACALVFIACANNNLWGYLPPLGLGVFLANSRGAWLVLAASFFARFHWKFSLPLIIIGSMGFQYHLRPSDEVRLQVWGLAIRGLNLLGWGPHSFSDVYYFWHDNYLHTDIFFRGEFVHNDYLQLAFEFGAGSLALFAIYGAALSRIEAQNWTIFYAFAVMGLYFFPLYHPLLAFISLATAGNLLCRNDYFWRFRSYWRYNFLPWVDRKILDIQ